MGRSLAASTFAFVFPFLAAGHAISAPPGSGTERILAHDPRVQWMSNYGYCGEMSLISAGLFYGQYFSQYDARAIASPGVPQTAVDSQLLLGVNDLSAATAMRLNAVPYRGRGARAFLTWVRRNIGAGFPVLIGLMMGSDDPDYDHIVPVFGAKSGRPLIGSGYSDGDTLTFDDLGVTGGDQIFSLSFRQLLTGGSGVPYWLPSRRHFGLAITGVMDAHGDTLPVSVRTDINLESPEVAGGDRPSPTPVVLTVTVSGLVAGEIYKIYKYTDFASVPTSRFNFHARAAAKIWKFRAASHNQVLSEAILSNEMAIFRAVKSSAP